MPTTLPPDLIFEPCNKIDAWTGANNINGTVTVSAGRFELCTNTAAANNYARMYRIIKSPPDQTTLQFDLDCDLIGSGNNFLWVAYTTATWIFRVGFTSTDVKIYKAGQNTHIPWGIW